MRGHLTRLLTLSVSVIALSGCGKDPARPIEQAPPAPQASNTAFNDMLNSQAEAPRLRLEPAVGILDLGSDRQVTFKLLATGGDIPITRVRVLPRDTLSEPETDCVGTLPVDGSCTITIKALDQSIPGSAVLIVDGVDATASADLSIVGDAPQTNVPVQDEPAVPPSDPDEDVRLQLEMEALLRAGEAVGPYDEPAQPLGNSFSIQADGSHTILAGTNITITLLEPILTTKDGIVRALVTWPVFGGMDPARKTFRPQVLLPANSMVTLSYAGSGGADGRIDLAVLSVRDAKNRTLAPENLPARDAVGQAGAPATIERRLVERSVAEFISTGLAVAPLLLSGGGSTTSISGGGITTTQDDKSKAADLASKRLTAYADEVTQQLIDTKPRERLGKGTVLTITPLENWVFSEAQTVVADPDSQVEDGQ